MPVGRPLRYNPVEKAGFGYSDFPKDAIRYPFAPGMEGNPQTPGTLAGMSSGGLRPSADRGRVDHLRLRVAAPRPCALNEAHRRTFSG
jgi:hypothetical protein